jgi:SAM-dependent methyltransferase
MRGARPILLPEFARNRIEGDRFVFDERDLQGFGTQYLYLANVKFHGGEQNSDFDDVWYHRHIHRSRELTRDARGTLLDIGCDTPSVSSRQFPQGVDYIGLEPSLQSSGEFCICGMAEFLPIRTASLDNVALMTSLDHILDDHKAIDEAFRVLRPGGYLYLASLVWNDRASTVGDTVHFHHFRDWEIQGLLRSFDIKRVQRYGWKDNHHRYGIYLMARKPSR